MRTSSNYALRLPAISSKERSRRLLAKMVHSRRSKRRIILRSVLLALIFAPSIV